MKQAKDPAAKRTLRRVLGLIRPWRPLVALSVLTAAVSVGAQLYIPILTGRAIDFMVGRGRVDFAGVRGILLEILAVGGCAALAQWLMGVCNNRIT